MRDEGEEAPVRTKRAWILSGGEESEVRAGTYFLAGKISVLTILHPSSQFRNASRKSVSQRFFPAPRNGRYLRSNKIWE
jgi:hypothetical protein